MPVDLGSSSYIAPSERASTQNIFAQLRDTLNSAAKTHGARIALFRRRTSSRSLAGKTTSSRASTSSAEIQINSTPSAASSMYHYRASFSDSDSSPDVDANSDDPDFFDTTFQDIEERDSDLATLADDEVHQQRSELRLRRLATPWLTRSREVGFDASRVWHFRSAQRGSIQPSL